MIILITGASHTGKTLLAQKMLEKYHYPYLSVDHLKMGLIRSGNTDLTPEDDDELTNTCGRLSGRCSLVLKTTCIRDNTPSIEIRGEEQREDRGGIIPFKRSRKEPTRLWQVCKAAEHTKPLLSVQSNEQLNDR